MKTTLTRLFTLLLAVSGIQLQAQNRVTVEAYNEDISYSLDLEAIASVFADARDLEDFEQKLNDFDSGLSNLDLNSDGYIDYLRVIETSEDNVHLVVIQAVLDREVYQDVASIVVERDRYKRTYVQIIGDPYLYGYNYIIEPVYYRTPFIVRWFWSSRYYSWNSPYYWGYYPRHYHYRRPIEINLYLTHVYSHKNSRHNYRYTDSRRTNYSERLHSSVGRNDYANRYPDKNFSSRNHNTYKNKEEYSRNRNIDKNQQGKGTLNNSGSGEANRRKYDNNNNNRGTDYNRYDNNNRNQGNGVDNGGRENRGSSATTNPYQGGSRGNNNSSTNNQVNRNSSTQRGTSTNSNPTVNRPESNRQGNVTRESNRNTYSKPEVQTRPTERPKVENKSTNRSTSVSKPVTKSDNSRSSGSNSKTTRETNSKSKNTENSRR